MTRSYQVKSTSIEVVPLRVSTVADPTGGSAPTFVFTQGGTTVTGTGSWGAWDAARSQAVALSPTLPAAGAAVTLAVGRWSVTVGFDVGGESVDDSPGVLVVVA